MLPNSRLAAQLQSIVTKQFYGDKAVLIQPVGTGYFDANNIETMKNWIVDLDCSFTDTVSNENWSDFADVENIDAEIRFQGSFPKKGDSIKLTGRFGGTAYPDKTFEIIGIKNRDAFGWVCALRAVSV